MLQWYSVRLQNPSYSICTYKYQQMFKNLTWYDLLEQPNRKMEAVSKLKYILLDDRSASSPYVRLLNELVLDPTMKWLKEMWTPTRFPQQEQLV